MSKVDEARALADVSAQQWGLVTTKQAEAVGVSRLKLARLTQTGHLERLAHGVYRDAGSPRGEFDDLRAAWLSTDPSRTAEERIEHPESGVVVAGTSAASLHDVGDFWADRHEFVAGMRRQSQRPEIRYRRRELAPEDVTLVDGLPTMTVERTIADLVEDIGDLSLVADALKAAWMRQGLDNAALRRLLAPLAARHGFTKDDGEALLEHLYEIAEIDANSIARRLASVGTLGSRITAHYVFPKEALESLADTFADSPTVQSVRDSLMSVFADGKAFQPLLETLHKIFDPADPSSIPPDDAREALASLRTRDPADG